MDEIHNDDEGHHDQHDAGAESGNAVGDGSTLGTVDNKGAAQLHAVEHGRVETVGVNGHIEAVENVFDDLTEGQSDDGQVVAPQTKHGDTDEEACNTGQYCADDDTEGHEQGWACDIIAQHGHGDDAGKSADAHKARVTQAQLAHDTNGKVQGQSHDDIDADGYQLAAQTALEDTAGIQAVKDRKDDGQNGKGDEVLPRGFRFP